MTTQTANLRLILPVDGEFSGTWGDQVNAGLTNLVDTAIAGMVTVSVISANQALTASNYSADQARAAIVILTTTNTAAFSVYIPPSSKTYVIKNTTAYVATVYCSSVLGNTTAAGVGVSIPAGFAVYLWTDGTNVYSSYALNALTAGTANQAASLVTTDWTVSETSGKLYFTYGGVNKASLDSSGNLIVLGNVTAYGTP